MNEYLKSDLNGSWHRGCALSAWLRRGVGILTKRKMAGLELKEHVRW